MKCFRTKPPVYCPSSIKYLSRSILNNILSALYPCGDIQNCLIVADAHSKTGSKRDQIIFINIIYCYPVN